MAHELATNARTGGAAMFWTGDETPWHGLGTKLSGVVKARDAMIAAGLDNDILPCDVVAMVPDGAGGFTQIKIPKMVANVRPDTMECLGVVSDRYKIIQNWESFDFLDSVAGLELDYVTAGALGKGERVWMLARRPGQIRVGRTDDVINKYLLLYNSHDGSSGCRALWTPVRVVCANTVRAALGGAEGQGVTIEHIGDIAAKVDEARRVLGLADQYFAAFGDGASLLASHKPTRDQVDSYFRALVPDPVNPDGTPADPAKARRVRMTLAGLFEQGTGQDMPGIKHTSWALFNAVTENIDHTGGNKAKARMNDSWFGKSVSVRNRAWDLAHDLVRRGTRPLDDQAPGLAVIGADAAVN